MTGLDAIVADLRTLLANSVAEVHRINAALVALGFTPVDVAHDPYPLRLIDGATAMIERIDRALTVEGQSIADEVERLAAEELAEDADEEARTLHPAGADRRPEYSCELCNGRPFTSSQGLSLHRWRVHGPSAVPQAAKFDPDKARAAAAAAAYDDGRL